MSQARTYRAAISGQIPKSYSNPSKVRPEMEQEDSAGPTEPYRDKYVDRNSRQVAIANNQCLRDDINALSARRDEILFKVMNMSYTPEIFHEHAMGMMREAASIVKTISLLHTGKYEHDEEGA